MESLKRIEPETTLLLNHREMEETVEAAEVEAALEAVVEEVTLVEEEASITTTEEVILEASLTIKEEIPMEETRTITWAAEESLIMVDMVVETMEVDINNQISSSRITMEE